MYNNVTARIAMEALREILENPKREFYQSENDEVYEDVWNMRANYYYPNSEKMEILIILIRDELVKRLKKGEIVTISTDNEGEVEEEWLEKLANKIDINLNVLLPSCLNIVVDKQSVHIRIGSWKEEWYNKK